MSLRDENNILKEQLDCLKEEAIQSRGGLIQAIADRNEMEEEVVRLKREVSDLKTDSQLRAELKEAEVASLRNELEALRRELESLRTTPQESPLE